MVPIRSYSGRGLDVQFGIFARMIFKDLTPLVITNTHGSTSFGVYEGPKSIQNHYSR